MSNEIDLYSNTSEVAPYSPSQPLAPAPDWGATDVDPTHHQYSQYSGGGQIVFGQTLPAGVTIQQMQTAFSQLSIPFIQDFTALKHKPSHVQAAVSWLMNALTNPPAQQRQRHSYNLYEHKSDPSFQAFANYAHDHGFSGKFVQDVCWWVSEITKKLNAQQVAVSPAQGRAPNSSSGDPTANLTDQQFNQLVAHNENVKAQTAQRLAAKYGEYSYQQVIQQAQSYLESLPANERQHFDRWTGPFPWVHFMNSFEAIDGLYGMAIGVNSIGNGADIAGEIRAFEAMLKIPAERAKYMKDPQLQNRFRELIRIRDGG